LSGGGCKKCANEKLSKEKSSNTEKFKDDAKKFIVINMIILKLYM